MGREGRGAMCDVWCEGKMIESCDAESEDKN